MSDLKMTCPSCGAWTNAVGQAARDGEPCPYCGRPLPEPTESEAPSEVYIVQWSNEPIPKEQWCVDRFWPFVEVYADWGQALRRWGSLRDEGISARMSNTRPIPPAEPCRECGPGYRMGDEGCRHSARPIPPR